MPPCTAMPATAAPMPPIELVMVSAVLTRPSPRALLILCPMSLAASIRPLSLDWLPSMPLSKSEPSYVPLALST